MTSAPQLIQRFTLGPYETNCYVVSDPGGDACWIVDAGFGPAAMIAWIRSQGRTPAAVVLTHAHLDHIAGVGQVRAEFPAVPILIHEAEAEWLGDAALNLSAFAGTPVTAPGPDRTLRHGDRLTLGAMEWDILHTPGHSPGGISLYQAQRRVALVGDALFAGSVGRTDFPGSDHGTLVRSITEQLYTLPGETVIHTGHGPDSTIAHEKRTNPFVRGE